MSGRQGGRRATDRQPDLFGAQGEQAREQQAPLAWRMRPRQLQELVGQEHLTGPDGALRAMVEHRRPHSAIFTGPPGCGKTSAARLLAETVGYGFEEMSATAAGVGDLRAAVERARQRWGLYGQGLLLFVDEIHRFSQNQQEVLLPPLEDGTLVLIGATTENPWVSLSAALLSRCLVLRFRPLSQAALEALLQRALPHLGAAPEAVPAPIVAAIARRAGGDARLALTVLERLWLVGSGRPLDAALLDRVFEQAAHYHDRRGDRHYDLISAFIKSMRGSDPDAALYWLGRMLAGGEDPRFIVRRLLVHAAEDVGLADPRALLVAQAAWTALEAVGLPEARIPIAMATIYLATAPKSNAVVEALAAVDQAVREHPAAPVPPALRDGSYPANREGAVYRYPHAAPGHFLPDRHFPEGMADRVLYRPSDQGEERRLERRLARWRAARAKARKDDPSDLPGDSAN